MKEKQTLMVKIIFIIVFFIVTFGVEFIYRGPLFDNSIKIAETVQNVFEKTIGFFNIYTHIGVIEAIWIGVVCLFFPISYCYTFFINSILTTHFCNYFKLLYGQGRPYLKEGGGYVLKAEPEKGYGNPSGHSFVSTTIYLGLAQLIIDYFELGIIPSIFIYIGVAILVLLVNFSRVLLGVHSINQIIFGDTLGFTVFFTIFIIFKPHLREPEKFYKQFLNFKYHIINLVFFVVSLTYTIVGEIICNATRKGKKEYEDLQKKLLDEYNSYDNQILTTDSVTKCFMITAYFGMVYGMTMLTHFVKKNYNSSFDLINNFNKNSNKKWYIVYPIKLLLIIFCYTPYIAFYLRPKNLNKYLNYILGSSLPLFIFGFLLFGPNFIFNIILGIGNKDIYLTSDIGDKLNMEYKLGEEEDED